MRPLLRRAPLRISTAGLERSSSTLHRHRNLTVAVASEIHDEIVVSRSGHCRPPLPFVLFLRYSCCYSCVVLALFMRYSCVILALFLRYSRVTRAVCLRYSCVIRALSRCYYGFIVLVVPTAPAPLRRTTGVGVSAPHDDMHRRQLAIYQKIAYFPKKSLFRTKTRTAVTKTRSGPLLSALALRRP